MTAPGATRAPVPDRGTAQRSGLPSAFHAKQWIAASADALLDLDARIGRRKERYVLAYHRVLPPGEAADQCVQPAMWVAPETFDAHLCYLRRIGRIVDLDQLLDFAQPNDVPWFALTFDDGWRDNYTHALPVLRRHGAVATVFLATQAVDQDALFWPEDFLIKGNQALARGKADQVSDFLARLADGTPKDLGPAGRGLENGLEHLKRLPTPERRSRLEHFFSLIDAPIDPLPGYVLTWDQVKQMQDAGIRFGSHTHTHSITVQASDAELRHELATSKKILEQRLGERVRTFCYPNARFRARDAGLLREAAYEWAFQIDDLPVRAGYAPFEVSRLLLYEDVLAVPAYFKLRLLGVPGYRARS